MAELPIGALPGTPEDYQQDKEGRWFHPDYEGLITLREGLTFEDYHAQRAAPEPEPINELTEIRERLDKLEAAAEKTELTDG